VGERISTHSSDISYIKEQNIHYREKISNYTSKNIHPGDQRYPPLVAKLNYPPIGGTPV
jgi:predicted Rossmann fold nucleotide-binding protein DprA/Smf involved in DNA uptake